MTVAATTTEWTLTLARHQAPLDAALARLVSEVGAAHLLVVVRSRELEDRVRRMLPFPAQVERLGALLGAAGHTPILDDDILPHEVVHGLLARALPGHYKGAWRDHAANEYLAAIKILATNGIRPPYPGHPSDPIEDELEAAHRALLKALRLHNAAGRFADFQRVLSAARRRGRLHSRHPNVRAVALFGIEWLSPAEEAAIEQVLKDVVDVHVLVVGRPPVTREASDERPWAALAHTDRVVRWAKYWSTATHDLDTGETDDAHDTTRAARLHSLFSLVPTPTVPLPGVHVETVRDPDDEVRRTAARIHDAIQAGTDPARIAVVSPRLERYTARIQEAFHAHGIPFTLRHEGRLAATTPGILLDLLLQELDHDHERDHFLDLAAHPLVRWRITDDQGDAQLNARLIGKTLAEKGHRPRGLRRWNDALARLPVPRRRDDEDTDPVPLPHLERQAVAARALLERLDALRTARDAETFFERLRALLDDLHVVRNAQRAMRRLPDPRALARALEAVLDLLDDTQRAYRLLDPTAKATHVRETLARRLHAATVPLPADRNHGVQVLGLRNASGLRYEAVHLLGATRDDLPPPRGHDRLMRLLDRRFGHGRLRRLDEDHEARRVLHAILSDTHARVHILVPERIDGEPRTASVLVQELVEAYELEPAPPIAPILRTRSDVHRHAARTGATWSDAPAALDATRALVAARADPTSEGAYSGHITDPEVQAMVAARAIGGGSSLSATRITTFARCAQRDLWHNILRLRGPEEREAVIGPLDKGSIVHHIIDLWTKDLIARNGAPARVADPANEEAVLVRLATDHLAAQTHDGLSWSAYTEELLGGLAGTHPYAHRPPGLLKRFLDDVVRRDAAVLASEIAFGTKDRPLHIDLPSGPIPLIGRIDRIEQTPEGLQVIDIKTGEPTKRPLIDGGVDHQIPLYALAAAQLFKQPVTHAGYQKIKRARDKDVNLWLLPTKKDPEDALHTLVAATPPRIDAIVQASRDGRFPLTLLDETEAGCAHCDQRLMCGRRAHHNVVRREHAVARGAAWGHVPDRARALVDAPEDEGVEGA